VPRYVSRELGLDATATYKEYSIDVPLDDSTFSTH